MPIEVSSAQARQIAELADQWGGVLALHQIPPEVEHLYEGGDLFASPIGEESRWRITVDGELGDIHRS
jgi:hypothetical protein